MSNIDKIIVVTAALLGAITVAIGAFGAHGLKEIVDEQSLNSFNTGVRYQMFHTLALLFIGLSSKLPDATKKWTFRFMILGILFFSGSIYVLSLKELLSFNASLIGFITPLGGILFIFGWLRLAFGLFVNK
jgi:uncharacterized membrane protein YgdD (TMEM256/DUF423 family)